MQLPTIKYAFARNPPFYQARLARISGSRRGPPLVVVVSVGRTATCYGVASGPRRRGKHFDSAQKIVHLQNWGSGWEVVAGGYHRIWWEDEGHCRQQHSFGLFTAAYAAIGHGIAGVMFTILSMRRSRRTIFRMMMLWNRAVVAGAAGRRMCAPGRFGVRSKQQQRRQQAAAG